MARWETDQYGTRWLKGWASREVVRCRAAMLGHDLALWYGLVQHGPYHRELGRCGRCGMVAGWGLLYRGKVAESLPDMPAPANAFQRLYRGKHRTPVGAMWGPALVEHCHPSPQTTPTRSAPCDRD